MTSAMFLTRSVLFVGLVMVLEALATSSGASTATLGLGKGVSGMRRLPGGAARGAGKR